MEQRTVELINASDSAVNQSGIKGTYFKIRKYWYFSIMHLLELIITSKILFLATLGFHCCMQAFSSCGKWGLLSSCMSGFLIVVSSPVADLGLKGA